MPSDGEAVPLADIGSHCRGAIFLNAIQLETPALRCAVDRAAKCSEGFFFGRFDVRSPSITDLREGRFEILELNGVASEATHIYDPSVTLREVYRVMLINGESHWRSGAANRDAGVQSMRLRDLVRVIGTRLADSVVCVTPNPAKNLALPEYFAGKAGSS